MEEELLRALESEPDRFVSVPRVEAREQFLWMAEFADTIDEEDVRARFGNALEGRGAFGRFKAVLYEYPDLRERWFAVRDARMMAAAEDWLGTLDVELAIERRPRPEPRAKPPQPSKPNKKLPPVKLAHLLVLGAAEAPSAPGRARRVVNAPGQTKGLFKQLVRELCESKGLGWRNRFIDGKTSFELEDTTIRHDDTRIEIEIATPDEVMKLFAKP